MELLLCDTSTSYTRSGQSHLSVCLNIAVCFLFQKDFGSLKPNCRSDVPRCFSAAAFDLHAFLWCILWRDYSHRWCNGCQDQQPQWGPIWATKSVNLVLSDAPLQPVLSLFPSCSFRDVPLPCCAQIFVSANVAATTHPS